MLIAQYCFLSLIYILILHFLCSTAHGKLSDKSPKDIFTGSRKSGNDDLNDHLLSTFPKLERETDPSDDSDDDEAEAVPSPQSYCRYFV